MTAQELIAYLVRQEVQLWVEGDKLRYRAKRSSLPAELLTLLKEHKSELVAQLRTAKPAIADRVPLSYSQKLFWILHQLNPASLAYNVAFAISLHGPLKLPVLKEALRLLLSRHPILRTRFVLQDGTPWQELAPDALAAVEVKHVASLSDEALLGLLYQDAWRPFALGSAVPVRLSLYQRSDQEAVLLICLHHILVDGSSVHIILRDLEELYRKVELRQPLQETTLAATYSDFVHWQHQLVHSAAGEAQLSYWKEALNGELSPLQLPTDWPRPPVRSEQGSNLSVTIESTVAKELRALATRFDATPFHILLAAFSVLLSRYSGQQDFVIGTPFHGRSDSRFQQLVGCFVNTIPLRIQLHPEASFSSLVAELRQRCVSALANGDYPFQQLVERIHPARDPGRTPLFQVMMAYENFSGMNLLRADRGEAGSRVTGAAAKGVNWELLPLTQPGGQFELTLTASEVGPDLLCTLSYRSDLFARATIARMLEHLTHLLRSAVQDPERTVGSLPMLSESERHQILVTWNQTAAPYPQDKCIQQLFEEQVERTPNAIAVVYDQQQLTYRELNARANQLAHHLRSLGVGPEVLVGLFMQRSVQLVVGILGILKAGGAYLPLDLYAPPNRLLAMAKDAGLRVILSLTQTTAPPWLTSLPAVQVVDFASEEVVQILHCASIDNLRLAQDSRSLAYVIYTSGSTGVPKGIGIEHRSVANLVATHQHPDFGGPPQRVALMASVVFDFTVKQLFGALLYGHALYVVQEDIRRDGALLLHYLRQHQIHAFDCTPSLLQLLLTAGLATARGLVLRTLLCGGEPLTRTLLLALYEGSERKQLRVLNLYGPTECCVDTSVLEIDSEHIPVEEIAPLGRPLPNMEVYILDASLQPVPVGVPGELCIGGVGVGRGYLNRPDLTRDKFVPHPFSADASARMYRSGDLARFKSDGTIEYLGRMDQQVKLRGYRIELGEIEAVLATHSSVNAGVVVLREAVAGDKLLVAYVVVKSDEQLDSAALRTHLATQLPEYMIPAAFVFLDALPLNSSGKLDRKQLPVPTIQRSGQDYVAPQTQAEKTLAEIFAKLLRLSTVSIHDDFFALGGNSLLAVRLVSAANQQGLPITVRDLFSCPTVAKLASTPNLVRRPSCLVELRKDNSDDVLLLLPGIGGLLYSMGMLARALNLSKRIWGLTTPPIAGTGPMPASLAALCAQYCEEVERNFPTGKISIIGHSFGGSAGLELARQLGTAGRHVDVVILLDTWAPGLLQDKSPQPLRAQLTEALDLELVPAEEAALSIEQSQTALAAALQNRNIGGRDPESMLSNIFDAMSASMKLLADWHPLQPEAPVHLLCAAEGPAGAPSDRGWGSLMNLASISTVEGTHHSMLRQPHLQKTVRTIQMLVAALPLVSTPLR